MTEERQTQSMIEFIQREAKEKAEELAQAAQEEYDIEKMRLVEAEKAKIRANLEKKKKQVEVDRRVASANHSKTQRIRLMEERAQILEELRENAKGKILKLVQDAGKYKTLLAGIMRQSVTAVATDCTVECRKEDESIVKGLIPEVQQWYSAQNNGAKVRIELNKNSLKSEEAWGGVIVRSADGRIICNNTLASRMGHCFMEQLPRIRYCLLNEDCKDIK